MPVNIFFLLKHIKEPINSLKRMSLKVKEIKLLTHHVSQKHEIIIHFQNFDSNQKFGSDTYTVATPEDSSNFCQHSWGGGGREGGVHAFWKKFQARYTFFIFYYILISIFLFACGVLCHTPLPPPPLCVSMSRN
jgi:hypothetical protein